MAIISIILSIHTQRAKHMKTLHYYTALIAMINSLDDQGLEKAYVIIQRLFLRYGVPGKGAIKEYDEKMSQLKGLLNL